jgi:SAM-dependent methyltransferase
MNFSEAYMKEKVRQEYNRILEYCKDKGLADEVISQAADYASGLWESYLPLLEDIPADFENKTVVDFGCKYGLLLPLFLCMGAKEAIGIDAVDEYLEVGRFVLEDLYPSIRIVDCTDGYIPLQPESIDIVFMNEVISHVNPAYLDTVYLETSRILKKGGIVYISDGNNIENLEYRKSLIPFYEAWENGPDGTKTDRDVVSKCFRNQRMEIIKEKYLNLSDSEIDYLARNTSGLFGQFFIKVIDEYVKTGILIERPYRKGICPTNPSSPGAVIERGFFPIQVELSLSNYGFSCYQVKKKTVVFTRSDLLGRLRDLYYLGKHFIKMLVKPGFARKASVGFQIIGIKEN